ncbi:PTHB1, N-terminal domain [Cinara cedri]|uniref:PTHB1, N-terminal domain n=1 Tax=Cinara cedri TaxID=506608 RepID=A0A5E4N9S9_9HEMI|nr:PTHB1, N-terminal domain [Cinara cedri]
MPERGWSQLRFVPGQKPNGDVSSKYRGQVSRFICPGELNENSIIHELGISRCVTNKKIRRRRPSAPQQTMSLFKARDCWSTACGRGETFGCDALTVDDLFGAGEDNVILGSLDGVLRVYGVHAAQPPDMCYSPSDLLVEAQTESPILQTGTGKLVRSVVFNNKRNNNNNNDKEGMNALFVGESLAHWLWLDSRQGQVRVLSLSVVRTFDKCFSRVLINIVNQLLRRANYDFKFESDNITAAPKSVHGV